MADVSITILFAADDQLSIRLETDGGPATADVPLLSGELIADLVLQLRSPRMAGAAARHLSEALGRVLFAGDAGETLRGLLRDDDDLMLFLATDPRLVEWPWELARDPETGSCPAMEAAAFVRESGGPVTVSNAARRAVLIVPGEHASARVGTLQAATRPLGRKLGVDVFALDPVTGPGLRRTLARGALFVHIETRLQGESLVLDDGHVPIERLGLDADTWLVVLGGPESTLPLHTRLRAMGIPLVLGQSTPLEPAAAAALDRELYRALAAGESLGESVRRARRALVRFGGLEGHAWAAPVLWSAPAVRGSLSPAAVPFPPPQAPKDVREPGATLLDFQTLRLVPGPTSAAPPVPGSLLPQAVATHPRGRLGTTPIASPAFIHETIRALREGRSGPELDARVEAMRALGGAAALIGQDAELAELDPAERTRRLTDRLVAAVSRPDGELSAPGDLGARLNAVAKSTGIAADRLAIVAAALLAGRGVVVTGAEPGQRWQVLVRVAEEVFDMAALVARGGPGERLVGGPVESGFGGYVHDAVALNWRRDELDPFRADAPTPGSRVPAVGGVAFGYRIFRGVWPVLPLELGVTAATVGDLALSLASGALSGVVGGRHFRVPLPADFRVLMSAPSALPYQDVLSPELTVVSLIEPRTVDEGEALAERERWLGEVERRNGPAGDVAESHLRLQLAERIGEVYAAVRPVAAVPSSAFAAALALALHLPGSPDDRALEALVVHVAPRLTRAAASCLPETMGRLRTAVERS
jgi:hypothetical protein